MKLILKKSQAAMEFIMNYGLVILMVLVVIAALSFIILNNKTSFLPQNCMISVGSGLACEDFSASIGTITLRINNLISEPIIITEAIVSEEGNSCHLYSSVSINRNKFSNLKLSAGPTCIDLTSSKKNIKGDLSITFIKNTFSRTVKGDIFVNIEQGVGVADHDICDNAHTYELCDGLDLAFGEGYKSACCATYGSCC
ncbi:MAG: hypothetical protein ABII01_00725 [Candidatus Woesearchaeota archaeon]